MVGKQDRARWQPLCDYHSGVSRMTISGVYSVGYAYPTSTHAVACGAGATGGYIVKRIRNAKTGALLKSPVLATKQAFDTKEQAQAYMANLED